MFGSPAVSDVFWQKVDNQQYARLTIGGRVSGVTLVSVSCGVFWQKVGNQQYALLVVEYQALP